MLFNSVEFWLFYGGVFAAYVVIPARMRWILLLLASYAFYMKWNASYIVLIVASTLVDYLCGLAMGKQEDPRRRKLILAGSLFTNLGLLFTFKYWTFFHESAVVVLGWVGVRYATPELNILLPVGISFYTFQTLSYTIDVYRRRIEPERHLGMFALYVSFFPQLVAGPIERAGRLLPQFRRRFRFDGEEVVAGLQLAAWGLFKKVVIADRLAIYVDAVYGDVSLHSGPTLVLATYFFAFQIYCDFSGYSDIAIGIARTLGFDLMRNFDRPYLATSIRDFWRRWHISLSTWLRDYLYVSLGGNRFGKLFTYRNLMITMLLGGLWHGASWSFVVWGALQGIMLSVSRASLDQRTRLWDSAGAAPWFRDAVRVFISFHLVCFSWVFFRAPSIGAAMTALQRMVMDPGGALWIDRLTFAHAAVGLLALAAVEAVQTWHGSGRLWVAQQRFAFRWATWYCLVLAILLLGVEQGAQFIYFQF